MSWIKVRVSRYTRELHPDDHQDGLPKPGELEHDVSYEAFHVQRKGLSWIGRTDDINSWLANKPGYYAEPKKAEKASVQSKKTARQPRRKSKLLPE